MRQFILMPLLACAASMAVAAGYQIAAEWPALDTAHTLHMNPADRGVCAAVQGALERANPGGGPLGRRSAFYRARFIERPAWMGLDAAELKAVAVRLQSLVEQSAGRALTAPSSGEMTRRIGREIRVGSLSVAVAVVALALPPGAVDPEARHATSIARLSRSDAVHFFVVSQPDFSDARLLGPGAVDDVVLIDGAAYFTARGLPAVEESPRLEVFRLEQPPHFSPVCALVDRRDGGQTP